jgi:hypothetical protein
MAFDMLGALLTWLELSLSNNAWGCRKSVIIPSWPAILRSEKDSLNSVGNMNPAENTKIMPI